MKKDYNKIARVVSLIPLITFLVMKISEISLKLELIKLPSGLLKEIIISNLWVASFFYYILGWLPTIILGIIGIITSIKSIKKEGKGKIWLIISILNIILAIILLIILLTSPIYP